MKRVWTLYRVSTKKQVNTDDDIPMQRQACHDFVKTKADWVITKELLEKGVSGWKKKNNERDQLRIIQEGAINKEFDILLVFMFDRLGRKEDETPAIVHFLNKHDVEVWSSFGEQRKTDTHIDKLLNYIEFWKADEESLKISMRVRAGKKQSSDQGFFQGGVAPIGYKIVETDQVHMKNKDRLIKELVPDEEESDMIQLIYSLYIERQMGYRKIVDYLYTKGYRNRVGKVFGVSTIQRILSNPIYTGNKRYVGFDGNEGDTQPYNEKLRIISDDVFEAARQIRNTRREKLNDQDKTGIPLTGKLMFSGIAYCKYCGAKLTSNYLYRKQKYNGKDDHYINTIYRYRCPMNKGKHHGDHKQNIWGAKKFDNAILKQLKEIISHLDLTSFIETAKVQKKSFIQQKEKNLTKLEKELKEFSTELDMLNSEIGLSLLGKSKFKPEQLSVAIDLVNQKINDHKEIIKNLKSEIENDRENYSDVNYISNELDNWEQKFDQADDDLKKAMLSRVINKVYFGKDEIEIELNLMLQECLRQAVGAENSNE